MDTQHARELEEHGIQAFRIERGAEVVGPDGTLGTVEQIVVDGEKKELQSLVVRGEGGMLMELPATRIDSATGDRVYLSIGRAELTAHPELARPFKPENYIPVDEGAVVSPGEVLQRNADAPLLTEMEEDAVEIATPADATGDELLDDEDYADIAEQPTIVLGPGEQAGLSALNESMSQPAMAEETAAAEATDEGGLVRPGALSQEAGVRGIPVSEPVPQEQLTGGMAGLDSQWTPEVLNAADEGYPLMEEVDVTGIAEPITPEPDVSMPLMSEPREPSTSPRVTEGAAYENAPQNALGVYVTAGILAGTAVASVAYLLWSRRERSRARGLAAGMKGARARLEGVRGASAAAQQALSAQLAPRALDARRRGARAARQTQSLIGEWWDQLTDRAPDLGDALGGMWALVNRGIRQARSATRNMPSAGDVRSSAASLVPTILPVRSLGLWSRVRDLGGGVQEWFEDTADSARGWGGGLGKRVRSWLPSNGLSWAPLRRTASSTSPQVATQAVSSKARAVRKATRSTTRRLGRRMRWFRRGMFAGTVWGILYAPVSGRETRSSVAHYLSSIPYVRDVTGSSQTMSTAGNLAGTGPHPRSQGVGYGSPDLTERTGTPLLEPTSEEPLLPTPDSDVSSLPGATPIS